MTREELLKRLQAGETDDFEVKEAAWGVPEDAFKTVSAFANSSGGWIVFGISEQDGGYVPTGVQNPDEIQTGFLGACRSTKLSGPVDIRPKQLRVGDAHVLAFRVQPLHRFEKPLRVRVKKEWGTYVRIGTGDHRCNEVEEARFLRDASYEHFDSQIYEGSVGLKDLDLDAVAWLRGFANRDPNRTYPEDPESFLRQLSLLRDEGITNAAVLLFGKRGVAVALKPTGIVDFRQMYSAFENYKITDGWDDREFCDGNVAEAARSLMGRFHRLTPQPFEMEPNGIQHKALSTDYLAVREALVNLLVHQDYTDKSRKAEILWYDDRIVFYNPGDSFVSPPEMLQGGFTETRNPLLLQTMRLAGFVEQVGQGVSRIVRVWEAAGRATPEILNDPGRKTYRLVLPLPWRAEPPVVIKSRRPAVMGFAEKLSEKRREPASPVWLRLDRDPQKALVGKQVSQLLRSDTRRILVLVAHASPTNAVEHFAAQLRDHLVPEVGDTVRWIELKFPEDRGAGLSRHLEDELRLQLDGKPGEPMSLLLRRQAPSTAAPGILWLDWGTFGDGQPQGALTRKQLNTWLRFAGEALGVHCPEDVRLVSFLAMDLEESKHERLVRTLQELRREPWCRRPELQLSHLPALGALTEDDLFTFLEDPGNSSCPPSLRTEAAQRMIEATGGEMEKTVKLLDEAEAGDWYELLDRLRGEQGAAASDEDDEPF